MSDLRELYQEVIIDHGRHPRNFGALPHATHQHEGFNPLCGDKIIVYLVEKAGVLEEIRFEGAGCAISTASASLMSEILRGKSLPELELVFAAFHALVTHGHAEVPENLGKLTVLGGVSEFPARVKCATLAWHTLKAALTHASGVVNTEEDTL